MSDGSRFFELRTFLRDDVQTLVDAHTRAKSIHRSKNIVAAGAEVEEAARALFQRRLPGAYAVGQGHLVDSDLQQSPQCDIVIADRTESQVLTTGGGKTSFFPYESVYAVGSVKSSYKKQHVTEFIGHLRHIRTGLKREQIYSSPLENMASSRRPDEAYLNPLFSFLLIVDGAGFKPSHIAELYAETPIEYLPSILCLINKGNVMHVSHGKEQGNFRPNPQPEMLERLHFNSSDQEFWPTREWQFMAHADDGTHLETNFGLLYFLLFAYLRACELQPAPLDRYLLNLFHFTSPQNLSSTGPKPPPGSDDGS